jgi:hypothetical protein
MNIKALIATLVLGSSSMALAAPSWSGGVSVQGTAQHVDRDGDRDDAVVRDHRGFEQPEQGQQWWMPIYRPAPQPVYQPSRGFVRLTGETRLEGRQMFDLDTSRQFRTLQVRAEAGQTKIECITIVFGDGKTEQLRPDVLLDASRNPVVTLPLQMHGRIDRLVIDGHSGPRGIFKVLAA